MIIFLQRHSKVEGYLLVIDSNTNPFSLKIFGRADCAVRAGSDSLKIGISARNNPVRMVDYFSD